MNIAIAALIVGALILTAIALAALRVGAVYEAEIEAEIAQQGKEEGDERP